MKNQEAEKAVQSIVEKKTSDLMNISFHCVCGKTHEIPIKYLCVKKGAVNEIGSKMAELGMAGKGGLVYDKKIENEVIKNIKDALKGQGITFTCFPVGDGREKIPPEIERAQQLAVQINGSADYLISAGSGVISDLTKKAAKILDLPYLLVATAPSMNGYTSSMAALTDRGVKQTLLIPPAQAVFADISILQEAPLPMVRSGLGDIVSKSVCNADWKLSQIVKNTYFCPVPFRMTDKTEPLYLEAAEEIGLRTEHGIEVLTDGIMRSGLSMTVIGTSTPSSGAEHVLAHYWDLIALIDKKEKLFHGVQVGVATLIILKLYEYMGNYPVRKKLNMRKLENEYPSREQAGWVIEQKFGRYAQGVKEEFFKKYTEWKQKKKEIEKIIDNWDSLWDTLAPFIRPAGPVEHALKVSGSAAKYTDLGKKREEVIDALLHAPLIRGRYTILDTAGDLGLMKEAAEKIV